jgi:ATP-dependent Zn protease
MDEGYRRGLAFHEAGHAVVAWCLGLDVIEIAIVDDPKDDSGVKTLPGEDRLSEINRLAVCLAGLEAESFFDAPTHEYGGISDHLKAMEIVGEDVPEEESQARRFAGYARAHELIRAHETQCIELAARLIESGRIGAAEFVQLMGGPKAR